MLLDGEQLLLWIRPKLAGFVSVWAAIAAALSIVSFLVAVNAYTSAANSQNAINSGGLSAIYALQEFTYGLFASGALAVAAALLWRQISQPIRIALAVSVGLLFLLILDVASTTPLVPGSGGNSTGPNTFTTSLQLAYGEASALVVALGVVAPCVASYLTWKNTYYAITNRRVLTSTGMVGRYIRETRVERVEDITLDQGLFGHAFGYGDIVFGTGSGSSRLFGLRSGRHGLGVAWLSVEGPVGVLHNAETAIERARLQRTTDSLRRMGAPAAASTGLAPAPPAV